MASLAPSGQQSLMNNVSQLTLTENPENNDHVTTSEPQPPATAAPLPAAPVFVFGAASGSGGFGAQSRVDESGAQAAADGFGAQPTGPESGAQAAACGFNVTFGAHGSSRRRQTKKVQTKKVQRHSPKEADTDYAAVQIKLNTVEEKLKNAAAAKDYVAAGTLQSEQKKLKKQFKTVYQAYQQSLKDKMQQRRSNGSPSIMSAQEMEQIRIKIWTNYIQRTFTPDLQLAVDQLLDIAQRRMMVAASKGVHFVDICNYGGGIYNSGNINGEELKFMHTVMTSRVAFSNFSWQLFRAGYQPSCMSGNGNQWIVRIRMLRSFEKQAEQIKMYLESPFVNYFERDCFVTGDQWRQPEAGLPATDVVSTASIQGCCRLTH